MADSPDLPPIKRAIPFAIAVAAFIEAIDSTVVTTALPAIARDLHVAATDLSSLVTAYLLAVTVLIPLSGWIADRFGARRVFAGAILLFTAASALAAASRDFPSLLIARSLQGAAGALMMPVARLIVLRTIPRERFVETMSLVTIPALVGPAIGPVLGGAITEWFGWPWIFLINLPIGIIGTIFVLRVVPDIQETRRGFDGIGFALFAVGLAAIVLACETAGRSGLGRAGELALGLGGVALLALYPLHARRRTDPALDLQLFRIASFRTSVIGGTLCRIGFAGTPFLLPLLFQIGFGLSPLGSGGLTFAVAVGAIGLKTVAPRVARAWPFKRVLIFNGAAIALALASFTLLEPTTPHAAILGLLIVYGFLRSLQFTFLNALAYADVPDNKSSHATSLASIGQQLSQSLGVALAATLLTLFAGGTTPTRSDFAHTFLACAGVVLVALLMFLRLPADAGGNMRGAPRGVRRGAVQDAGQQAG
ncbi:MAG: Drug resistance transporter [Rhodospirillales bacterium]|nr:Drug resistance transporter [Rhodospirillales bacterium]